MKAPYALTASEVAGLEWESLVGEIRWAQEDIKAAVEERRYETFHRRVHDLRLVLDELERRMRTEQ